LLLETDEEPERVEIPIKNDDDLPPLRNPDILIGEDTVLVPSWYIFHVILLKTYIFNINL